jgi:hypothetical protein
VVSHPYVFADFKLSFPRWAELEEKRTPRRIVRKRRKRLVKFERAHRNY